MRRDEHLLHLLEATHVPLDDPQAPADWKEWYHFILVEPQSGTRVLANASLSGIPGRGQIIATMVATLAPCLASPSARTFGFSSDWEWEPGMVRPAPVRIEAPALSCEIAGRHSRFAASDPYGVLTVDFHGRTTATPVVIPELSPFGSGFIGWGLVPGVEVEGSLGLDGRALALDREWFCYHDHNYGRFRWGEDIGWIWFVAFLCGADGERLTLVLHRGNDRQQRRCGAPYVFVYRGERLRKVFMGRAVHLAWRWTSEPRRPPRLPGSMATLYADRTLLLPVGLELRAADERDRLALDLAADSNLELVLADNRDRQTTFIEEASGDASLSCRLDGEELAAQGHFYAEFVH